MLFKLLRRSWLEYCGTYIPPSSAWPFIQTSDLAISWFPSLPGIYLYFESYYITKYTNEASFPQHNRRHYQGIPKRQSPSIKSFDFCLHINPRHGHAPEDRMADRILRGDLEPPSINHTDFPALHFQPIAVSIETKRPGGDPAEAHLQMGVW